MEIKDYIKKEKAHKIRELFLTIYPGDFKSADKMAFDEGLENHVCTKVACNGETIVGQSNVFYLDKSAGIANLGYHVHPDFRQQGLGEKLSRLVIEEARQRGVRTMVTRIDPLNTASIRLAEKLGFERAGEQFLEVSKGILQSDGKMVSFVLQH